MKRIRTVGLIALVVAFSLSLGAISHYKNKLKLAKQNETALLNGMKKIEVENEAYGVKIKELEQSIKMLDIKQDEAYVKLDEIKLDKAVFNATMQQMQLIQTDIREIGNMMQTMHK